MCENKEQVLQEIRAILNGTPLESFDVRKYELSRILEENYETVREDLDRYRATENMLVRICIGKKWAPKLDFDYDASRFVNFIYKVAWFPLGDIEPIGCVEKYEYVTVYDGRYFRGDTMNSWSTTLNEFVRKFGKEYVYGWKRRYIPDGYGSWEEFLSVPDNYIKEFPPYITEFMRAVYTIGNFIPVPKDNFNTYRNRLCKDYWDLTLLAIYRHYEKNDRDNSDGWKNLLSQDGVKHWLDGYGSWDAFVEGNFLQDFVNQEGSYYGKPKELWKGHFINPGLPKGEGQFEEFFTNAAAWITARGEKIALALADALGPTAEQESNAEEGII